MLSAPIISGRGPRPVGLRGHDRPSSRLAQPIVITAHLTKSEGCIQSLRRKVLGHGLKRCDPRPVLPAPRCEGSHNSAGSASPPRFGACADTFGDNDFTPQYGQSRAENSPTDFEAEKRLWSGHRGQNGRRGRMTVWPHVGQVDLHPLVARTVGDNHPCRNVLMIRQAHGQRRDRLMDAVSALFEPSIEILGRSKRAAHLKATWHIATEIKRLGLSYGSLSVGTSEIQS